MDGDGFEAMVAGMERTSPRAEHRLVGKAERGGAASVGVVFEDSPLAPFLVDAMGADAPLLAPPARRERNSAHRPPVWRRGTTVMALACGLLGVLAAVENGARFRRYAPAMLGALGALGAGLSLRGRVSTPSPA